jgi:acyl-CoA thioesterase
MVLTLHVDAPAQDTTDSHLPPRNKMLDQLEVSSTSQLQAPMEPGYAAFKGAFGGWTAAHALLAAQTLGPQTLQPAALSTDFLSAVTNGLVTSAPEHLRRSSRAAFVRVSTSQGAELRASTAVLLAARPSTERIDASLMPGCTPPEDLPRLALPPSPNTWIQRFDMRVAQGRLLERNPDMRSLTWTRLEDTAPSGHVAMAALADASLPRIYFHLSAIAPIATATMSVHFLADASELAEALEDFVLVDAGGHVARHGCFDQHVRIWSRSGLLLATLTQLARYELGTA